jgi:DNA-binding winged helix-turn-helix (wHTH) protein
MVVAEHTSTFTEQKRNTGRPLERTYMRTDNNSSNTLPRVQRAFASPDLSASKQRLTSLTNSATRSEQQRSFVPGGRIPPFLRKELVEFLADVIHSLVSSELENIAGRIRKSILGRDEPLAITSLGSSEKPLTQTLTLVNDKVLRVGSLELDLIDRTAKRGDRRIDLRPREFQLLKYMMQRHDKLLTRAALLKEVWHYKFVPKTTNLVDVQMGLLRRKVDEATEAPMIRSVRGSGFVLDTTLLSQDSRTSADAQSTMGSTCHAQIGEEPSPNSDAEQERFSAFDEKPKKLNEILEAIPL